jgi:ribosomal protein S18 acetylase RimI-like enzyme
MSEQTIVIRPAIPEDAPIAAQLLYQTMGRLADYIFGSEPQRTVIETITHLYCSPGKNRLCYRFAWILELEGMTAGILVSYPGMDVRRLDLETGLSLAGWFSLPSLVCLAWRAWNLPGIEALPGEYYLSNVSVLPEFQGRGHGSRLLAFAEEQACGLQITRCSLCVDMDNTSARRLYERTGYHVSHVQFNRQGAERAGKGYFRMLKLLSPPPPVGGGVGQNGSS